MTSEIDVARIEQWRLTDDAGEHRRLEIVDHQAGWATPERREGVLMGGEEMLHGLRDGELDVHQAAVAQHHDEEGQSPTRRADRDAAVFAPVNLGAFPGGKGELEKGGPTHRPDLAYIRLDDRVAARKTFLAQALEDLLRAVRVAFQQANDARLEGVEATAAWWRLAGMKLRDADPLRHRVRIQSEGAGGLRDGQLLPIVVILDLAVGFVVDHGVRPRAARS